MKAIRGNAIVKIDVKQKEKYALTKDVTIYIEKGYNFNQREDRAGMGYVVDGEGLKQGVPVLCHYLAMEPNYLIEGETILTESERLEGYRIISIPLDMALAYFDGSEWQPCKNFLITSRIFKPYKGKLHGIEPERIENRLYIWKGVVEDAPCLEGKVCVVTKNSDYEIIFHNKENREGRVIRTRTRDIEAIDLYLTNKVKNGKLLVGFSPTNLIEI